MCGYNQSSFIFRRLGACFLIKKKKAFSITIHLLSKLWSSYSKTEACVSLKSPLLGIRLSNLTTFFLETSSVPLSHLENEGSVSTITNGTIISRLRHEKSLVFEIPNVSFCGSWEMEEGLMFFFEKRTHSDFNCFEIR